ncbi:MULTISPECIES: hypothetical protein [Stenotrophomonas]|jgi:predicted protein tyrosine phosphatase|uniref:Uncharacterized protein n=1 Tax=Stenotrophomonas maltophilia TaxID=40324 RepID=A0A4V3RIE8_STEMA|nr:MULTISPECIES: hypothetical protein [Stenotrophomonas]MBD3828262.1 hypothetical protein [Stenotrophomonas sp.]QIO88454.1 hypothetical protein G9274_002139 [Stenotrophomonas rhizophila]TGY31870.1 hypothetical protein E5352_18050 [Stenotrophomonas maltophilia]
MHPRLRIALLALLGTVPALAQAQHAEPAQDLPLTALLGCHFGYAQQHHRSTASATEIALAAASHCDAALQAAGLDTYRRALEAGLPVDDAEASRQAMIEEMRAMLPGFTIDKVIQARAAAGDP